MEMSTKIAATATVDTLLYNTINVYRRKGATDIVQCTIYIHNNSNNNAAVRRK